MGRHPGVRRPRPRRPVGRAHRRPPGRGRPRRRAAAPSAQWLPQCRRRAGARAARHARPIAAAPGRNAGRGRPRRPHGRAHPPARRNRAGRARRHRRAGRGSAQLGRRAPLGGDRRRRHRAPHGAGPPARRPRRARQQPAALRLRLVRGAREVRGAGGGAAPRNGGHLLRGRIGRVVQHGQRADAAHARRLRRAEPDARAARARRRARPELRGVHGAVRRHVPREPAESRRAAGATGRAHGGGPGRVELHEPRAAGPAAQPHGLGPRGHGPALAGGAAGAEPPARRARRRLAEVLRVQRRRAHGHEPGHRPGHPAGPARPHGGGAPVGLDAGGTGRDRPGPGAPAHGRGRRPGARPPGQPDQVAGRRRAH